MTDYSIVDRIENMDKRMDVLMEAVKLKKELEEKEEQVKQKKWKLPFKTRWGAKKKIKDNKVLCFMLRLNRSLDYGWGECDDKGVVHYRSQMYDLDAGSVYILNTKIKIPVVVIFEWRNLIAGQFDEYKYNIMGGMLDKSMNDQLVTQLLSYGQKIGKKEIELQELAKIEDAKKKKSNLLWIILFGVGALALIFIVLKFLGKA